MIGAFGGASGGGARMRAGVSVAPAAGVALAFASDWSTATEATANAVSDGSSWPGVRCGSYLDLLTVVAAPTGWPTGMDNVLRVSADGTGCGMITKYDFPVPTVGNSIWYRVYLQYVSTSNDVANQHFLQPNNDPYPHPWNWRWSAPINGGTQVRLEWILVNQFEWIPATNNALYAVTLDIGTLYRLEWEFDRTATLSAVMRPRIYVGDSETVTFDNTDFLDQGGGSADGDPLSISTRELDLGRAAELSEIELGQNGPSGATSVVADYFRAGGFAASTAGWIGPYTAGEGA